MRVSQEEKAKSRERIVNAASQILRKEGLAKTGVVEVMSAAQMTHGGFYRHFANREELLTEALRHSFEEVERMARTSGELGNGITTFVQRYLSLEHRDALEQGCPAAALGSELSRGSRELQQAFSLGLEELIAALQENANTALARSETLVLLSTLVGALILARATNGTLSDEILIASRAHTAALKSAADR